MQNVKNQLQANQVKAIPTLAGVKYILPARQTSKYRKAGWTLICAGIVLAMVFLAQQFLMGGWGFASILLLTFGSLFDALLILTGIRILTNRTRHEVELKEDGWLICRELLLGNLAFTRRCRTRDIEFLDIEPADEFIYLGAECSDSIQIDPDLRAISARGENGRELLIAPFYPSAVIEAVADDLLPRLYADTTRNDPVAAKVDIVPTATGVRYVLPERNTEGYRSYVLMVVPVIVMIISAVLFPLFDAANPKAFLSVLGFMSIPITLFALIGVFVWKLFNNKTRHEVELRNNYIYSSEYVVGPLRLKRCCLASEVSYLSVESTGVEEGNEDERKNEDERQSILSYLFPQLLYGALHGKHRVQLAIAPGYPRETILAIAEDLAVRLELEAAAIESGAGHTISSRVVDLSTPAKKRNVEWVKPAATRANVHEADNGTVFEYQNCSLFRHGMTQVILLPACYVVMMICFVIFGWLPQILWLQISFWVSMTFGLIFAIYKCQRSTVRIAAMDGFLMIEEESILYSRVVELTREEIKSLKVVDVEKKNIRSRLVMKTHAGLEFNFPDATRHELNWVEMEIRQRVLIDPESSASDVANEPVLI